MGLIDNERKTPACPRVLPVCDASGRETGDYVHVDDNPAQITEVETAVEREGADSGAGFALNVTDFVYQPNESQVFDLDGILGSIDEEIGKIAERQASR